MMQNNQDFIKKNISKHIQADKEKDVLVIFVLQEMKNSNLFGKNLT